MERLQEKLVDSKKMYEGRIINVRCDLVELPNGNLGTREVVEHPGAVAIVPVTGEGQVVMVRQYRHPAGEIMLEIPAGKLERGEDPEACARRELAEETGLAAGRLKKLVSAFTTPGFTNEIIHIFLAEDLAFTSPNTDEDEFLNVELFSKQDIAAMIRGGELRDAKTLLGFLLAGFINE